MPLPHSQRTSPWMRIGAAAVFTSLCLAGITTAPVLAAPASTDQLPVSDSLRTSADIGFHDYTRTGTVREIRNDLTGKLGGMVELAQASTSNPTGNSEAELPTPVAERTTLLMFTPTSTVKSVKVKVSAKGKTLGTLSLAHPNLLPASDQSYDSRGSVAYSLRAWSATLPWQWVQPGLELTFTADNGNSGTVSEIDIAAPTELVINNIELGMLTAAPQSEGHHFINDPVDGATDYFQTIPVSRLTMAQYEDVTLDKVIVATGAIYTEDNPDPSIGSVYAGTMRENVGKAQVSTGINLATWGITSSAMTQRQPANTNQRIIHHSAGLYKNEGIQVHGLSGGNGMATLYSSIGNELSHELGHSYGLGHYPGRDAAAEGDDIIRNASHNMDSGWGYISYRNLMRSNLSTNAYVKPRTIEKDEFYENLAGKYNFNTDTMAGGFDASPVSDYTHATGYSLKRMQTFLKTLVADTSYPSGYRNWDEEAGEWVDAKELNADFDLLKPKKVGGTVFSILGGYNPANSDQTLVYPAFRSNYGVTFDLPQEDPASQSETRACWLEVNFQNSNTKYISLDASDGVKQLNVNIAETDKPTGAQVACRADGKTTKLGNKISIATNLDPMDPVVVVGQEEGNEALRKQELKELEPVLEGLASEALPVVGGENLLVLQGWSDDLSPLSKTAQGVAEKALTIASDAVDISAYANDNSASRTVLTKFMQDKGYTDAEGNVIPAGTPVTVDKGACLFINKAADGTLSLGVDSDRANCAETHADTWFVDAANRIHSAQYPQFCLTSSQPIALGTCVSNNFLQQWKLNDDGTLALTTRPGTVLDYDRSKARPTTYSKSNTSNQLWVGFELETHPLFTVLDGADIAVLVNFLTSEQPAEKPAQNKPAPSAPAEMVKPAPSAPAEVPAESGNAEDNSGSDKTPVVETPVASKPSTGTEANTAVPLPDYYNDDVNSDDNIDDSNPTAGKAALDSLPAEHAHDHEHDHEGEDGDDHSHDSGTAAANAVAGSDSDDTASKNADTKSGSQLPVTGTSLISLVIALVVLAVGGILIAARRRMSH